MEKQPLKPDSAERLTFYGTELSPVSVAIGNINNFSILLSRQSASTAVPPFNEMGHSVGVPLVTCTSSDRANSTQKGPIFLVERLGKPVANNPSLKTKAH